MTTNSARTILLLLTCLASCLAGCGSKSGTDSGTAGKKGHVNMTVDEFRKVLEVGFKQWKPKTKFYAEFGEPLRIADVGDETYLYYQCTDGMARIECGKGEFQNQDQIRALGVDRP